MYACNFVVYMWVTHILSLLSLPPFLLPSPSLLLPFLFPSLLTFLSLLPGSVETPSSGVGPPTREWVLVGVAGSSQLGSNKRIKEKVANTHRVIHEFETNRQALQEPYSQQGLDRRVQDAETRARDLQIQLKTSQDAYQQSQQSLQKSSKSPSSLSKNHKLRKEISEYSLRLHKMPTMNPSSYSNSPSNLSKQHKLRKKTSRPKQKISREGCKMLSRERKRLRGGLVMPGRGQVKVNLHGWCRGTRSTSQIQSLGEEAGLLFELQSSVEFIVQPSVSTDRSFPTTIEFCSLVK